MKFDRGLGYKKRGDFLQNKETKANWQINAKYMPGPNAMHELDENSSLSRRM